MVAIALDRGAHGKARGSQRQTRHLGKKCRGNIEAATLQEMRRASMHGNDG